MVKSSKAFYSSKFPEYILSNEQIDKLHDVLFGMLKDFKYVCDKHNIKYMLCGGTLLGAIRHKGFIPWDDDIDIMMTREYYNLLEDAFKQEFPDKYLIETPESNKKSFKKCMKIYLLGTYYSELEMANCPFGNHIFLDVFPIENAPKSPKVRKIRGKIYDLACLVTGLIADYKYPSAPIIEKSKTDKEIKKRYFLRRAAGGVFSLFFGMRFYMFLVKILGKYSKDTGIVCIPSGIRYNREVFSKELFNEYDEFEFCGEKFLSLKNYEEYLHNLYKNYMEIPPESKRERHVAYRIDFGKYGE